MTTRGFVKLQRSELTRELFKDPNAFILLSLIATRARFSSEANVSNLKFGEAQIGDHDSCGLTRKEYRTALNRLEHKWGLVESRGTPLGTVVRLVDSRVYSISDERNSAQNGQLKGQPFSEVNGGDWANEKAIEGPTRGQRGATTKKDKNDKNEREKAAPALDVWLIHADEIKWQRDDATAAFYHFEASGWRRSGGNEIKDWKAAARACHQRATSAAAPLRTQANRPEPTTRRISLLSTSP